MSEDDPITGIGVIESISNVPQGYVAITTSADGKDADIWKDGFFARAVRRYICYTRVFPLDNGRWRNVVKDIKIVKDGTGEAPPGYVVISQTMGSAQRQPALQGLRLFIKNEPREVCDGAFTDLLLVSKGARNEKTVTTNYIKIGELNGMFLYGKWKNLSPLTASSATVQSTIPNPATERTPQQSTAAMTNNAVTENGFELIGGTNSTAMMMPQQVCRPNDQWSAMTLERQKSEVLTTGIDGVKFVINPKYSNNSNGAGAANPIVIPSFDTMTMDQIDSKSTYSLDLERSLVN